jgi:glycosyltransferase involved in cell wall biosynthesis
LKSALKYLPYRWFLNRIDAHLYVGRANRDYLRSYGVPDGRLFFVPHFVDNAFFTDRSDRARDDGNARALRGSLGIGESALVFMFAGKFIEKKRPHDFIRACALAARQARGSVHGIMVGDGPLRTSSESLAAELGAPVHFVGFRNQTELPVCYAAADFLVLASDARETWGLVVNEAMACGLPALVTRQSGCADDLVQEGLTGFTYEVGDIAALADRMAECGDIDIEVMRRRARAHVSKYSVDNAVEGTLIALRGGSLQALAG